MQWLARVCVQRPVFASVLMLVILVLGTIGYRGLGVDQFPNVDVPVVVVTALGSEMARYTDAAAVLPKPVDMDELLHVVCDFCNGSARG